MERAGLQGLGLGVVGQPSRDSRVFHPIPRTRLVLDRRLGLRVGMSMNIRAAVGYSGVLVVAVCWFLWHILESASDHMTGPKLRLGTEVEKENHFSGPLLPSFCTLQIDVSSSEEMQCERWYEQSGMWFWA